jgi:dolichol-phosphate mannosyltransferase
MMIDLSIVIPAYREAEALTLLLPGLKAHVEALSPRSEILVIDTQMPLDHTADVCLAQGVRHVPRTNGNAYGDAVRTGIAAASGEFILFMDADGSHNPSQLRFLWEQRDAADLVIGSRYVDGGVTENPAILIFMSWVVNVTYRFVFGLQVKDVSNSLRLYRKNYLQLMRLKCDNFDIIQEILIRAPRLGATRILEVPITFEKRKAGESKRNLVKFAFSYIRTILRLIRYCATD